MKWVQFVVELKKKTDEKINDLDHDKAQPFIQSVSAVLKAGRVTADGALVGTKFLSWFANGKYKCIHVCCGVEDLELVFVPPCY